MDRKIKAVVALGVIGMAVGMLIPTVLDSTTSDSRSYLELYENDSATLTDRLSIELVEANGTSNNATYYVTDESVKQNVTAVVPQSSNETVQLSGENITVYANEVWGVNYSVRTVVDYPGTFAWDSGAAQFIEYMPIFLMLITGIILFGILYMVMKND